MYESKEEGTDQESIQAVNIPDLGYHMGGDKNTRKHHTQDNQEASSFQSGDQKAAMSRQDSITKTDTITNNKNDQQKKHHTCYVS